MIYLKLFSRHRKVNRKILKDFIGKEIYYRQGNENYFVDNKTYMNKKVKV